MLDDDIQYMGTRSPTKDSPFFVPQVVAGVILHVEKSTTDASYSMIFRRTNTSVIHIGRRPGNQEPNQGDTGRAMFRCAVVSRKHAKIAFSDSGHAYLIDMNSHHGTHLRKLGETVSKILNVETPVALSDGDIITFGKSVGRNNEVVRPVVVRIELIHGPRPDVLKPLVIPSHPITPVNQNRANNSSSSSSSRSSSGRYGVYIPSSSSSDSDSSPISDHESEIEEIPASGANALPLRPRGSLSIDSGGSHLGRAFEALKRLLPPVHAPVPIIPSNSCSGAISSSSLPIHPWPPSPNFSLGSPGQQSSPIYSPYSPPRSFSPGLRSPIIHPLPPIDCLDEDHFYPFGFDAAHNDVFENLANHSDRGSSSPMDLASPSPALSACRSLSPDKVPTEPKIIGAWPKSRPTSPVESSPSVEVTEAQPPESSIPVAISRSVSRSPSQAQTTDNPKEISVSAMPIISPVPEPSDQLNLKVSDLQSCLAKLQGEVTKLQTQRRKYKSRFNTNVHTISDRLLDLDERISDVNAQYTMLLDQVESATHIDIPDLQLQVEALQHQAEALPSITNMVSETVVHEQSDAKASIQTLQDLVGEMQRLRETTQAQMALELDAVRVARDAALATIAAHVQAQTPVQTSLKRKRCDDEDGDELKNQALTSVAGVDCDAAGVGMTDLATPTTLTTATMVNTTRAEGPSPKRAKRIAAVVVQTATAVTVGAVATWSALAFS